MERKMFFHKLTLKDLEEMETGVSEVIFEGLRRIISILKPKLAAICTPLIIVGSGCGYRSKYVSRCIELFDGLYLSEYGTFVRLSFCSFGGDHCHVHAVDLEAIRDIPPGKIGEYLKKIAST